MGLRIILSNGRIIDPNKVALKKEKVADSVLSYHPRIISIKPFKWEEV